MTKTIFLFAMLLFAFYGAEAQTDFIENFDNNDNGWEEVNSKNAHTKIKSGRYFISHKRRNSGWASTIEIPIATALDFKITTTINKIIGVNNHGFGLIWGWKDAENYSTFIISSDGNYSIKHIDNGKTNIAVNWKLSSYINKGGDDNQLTIEKKGRELIFYINEKMVEKIGFKAFKGRKIGFLVNRNIRIKIDYLKILYNESNSSSTEKTDRYTSFDIKKTEIDDGRYSAKTYGNANGAIDAGETIETKIQIQNTGNATENDLWVWCDLLGNYKGLSLANEGKKQSIKMIAVNETADVRFDFFLSGIFRGDKIKVRLTIENSLGEQIKKDLNFDVGKAGTLQKEIPQSLEPSVDINIPTTKNDGSTTYALIFGINNYKYAPKAAYADKDAEIFYKYVRSVYGVPEQNIYLKTNEDATSGEFEKVFGENGWLERRIKSEDDRVIIFYAGHGIPETKGRKSYLMPYDADPAYPSTAFHLQGLYQSLSKLKSKEITVFIDACFSGVNRGNQTLIEGNRAVKIRPASPLSGAGNLNVITACSANEYSGIYNEQQHGLFTYYLLRALKGEAKGNNKELTMSELYKYVQANVSNKAVSLDKEQSPTTNKPNSKMVVVKY